MSMRRASKKQNKKKKRSDQRIRIQIRIRNRIRIRVSKPTVRIWTRINTTKWLRVQIRRMIITKVAEGERGR